MLLAFQLKAPLGAFGDAQANIRHTATAPRKSAIVGLLAAALGITRDQTAAFAALVQGLTLATAELKAPHLLLDYHTVQAPVAPTATAIDTTRADQVRRISNAERRGAYSGTMVTQRAYLQDGHWLVVLQGEPELLRRLKDALEQPSFTLYLGRKSCPLSAFTAPVLLDAETLEEAVTLWSEVVGVAVPEQVRLTWEPSLPTKTPAQTQALVRDNRRNLRYFHFAPRMRNEAVWQPKEGLCS